MTEMEIKLKNKDTVVNYLEDKIKTLDQRLVALQTSLQSDADLLEFE